MITLQRTSFLPLLSEFPLFCEKLLPIAKEWQQRSLDTLMVYGQVLLTETEGLVAPLTE